MNIFANKELAQKLENTVATCKIEFIETQNKLNSNTYSVYKKNNTGYAIYAHSFPSLCIALGLGLNGKVNENEIIQLEEFFKEKKSPVKIDVSCLADMSLTKILLSRGYTISDYTNMLIKPLSSDIVYEKSGNCRVEEVTETNINIYAETVTCGFIENSDASDTSIYSKDIIKSFEDISKISFQQPNVHCFIAYKKDEAAGGGGMFINKDVVYYVGTSTLLKYRNLGIQTGLLKHRLNYSVSKGCNYAITITFPGSISQHNVEKLGFQVAYSRILFTKEV